MLQPIKNTLKKYWDAQVIVIVKVNEYAKNNYRDNDKPFEHIG